MNRQPAHKHSTILLTLQRKVKEKMKILSRQLFVSFLACWMGVSVLGETEVRAQEVQTKSFTLQEIIDLTLTHNPTMELSKGVIDEKEGERLSAAAYPNPLVGLKGGHGQILDPTGPSVTERYVTLSQPLEWPGMRVARKDAAEAAVEGAQAGLDETQVNLRARVKKAFYELILAQRRAELASKTLTIVQELGQAVKKRVESGEAPPFENVKVEVEKLKAKTEVARSQGMVRAAKAGLNTLTAGALGIDFSVQGTFKTAPKEFNVSRSAEQALEQHPTIRKYQKLVKQATEHHRQEQQARVPNVTISGSYERDAGREGFVGGVTVPIPLWNLRQGDIAKALARQHQAEAHLQRVKNDILKGITQQVQFSQTAATQIATFEQGLLKQAREAVRIAQVSFRFGEANLLEVLDAQRVLWQTFQGYAQARYDLSVALTELERLVGKEL